MDKEVKEQEESFAGESLLFGVGGKNCRLLELRFERRVEGGWSCLGRRALPILDQQPPVVEFDASPPPPAPAPPSPSPSVPIPPESIPQQPPTCCCSCSTPITTSSHPLLLTNAPPHLCQSCVFPALAELSSPPLPQRGLKRCSSPSLSCDGCRSIICRPCAQGQNPSPTLAQYSVVLVALN
jgi:hypothetical protein